MAMDGESSSSGEESEVSEYEKQRFSRIAENKARLEALGISKSATALLGTWSNSMKRRGKRNSGEEDCDYRPGEADDDEDEEFLGNERKNKTSASKRTVLSKKNLNRSDSLGQDDDDLKKAIALSLQDSVPGGSGSTKRRNDQEAGGNWKKKKTEFMSRMQMTEDELVIYICLIHCHRHLSKAGKAFITLRDVTKMAMVHDFTWTEEELQDMIRCFDIDKDGKLSLDEFMKIVTRCRMLKES